ncbi:MAG: diadenylate cyclase CdaA [Planctomycetota bacterium]
MRLFDSILAAAPFDFEGIKPIIEVAIIFFTLFGIFRFLRGSGGHGVLKGMVIFFVAYLLLVWLFADRLELYRIDYILKNFLNFFFIAVLIVFQPELRRGLIRLSQNRFFTGLFGSDRERTVNDLVAAVVKLSKNKTGALIALEKGVGLQAYAEGRTQMDALITTELIETVFYFGTPLHDGGMIVRDNRIVAAGCLFPLTDNANISRRIGTRHRAAIGLTEESDCLVIVVSEETGLISVAQNGVLNRGLDRETLIRKLMDFYRESARIKAETSAPGM